MKPILFNTGMVRRLLDGTKTVTRRVVKPQPPATAHVAKIRYSWCWSWWEDSDSHKMNPPYHPGDILYVRETWGCYCRNWQEATYFCYRADYSRHATCYTINGVVCDFPKWRPSIHMPREAARIFLRVTDVRVEKLQNINTYGTYYDGIQKCSIDPCCVGTCDKCLQDDRPIRKFISLWDSTIKKADRALYGWDANPWVWVIEFERISREEAVDNAIL